MIGKHKYVVIAQDNTQGIVWEKTQEAAGKVFEAKNSGKIVKEILPNKEYLLRVKQETKIQKKVALAPAVVPVETL
ncbi:MAG TPA: hypothetical protein VI911_10125 [Patescibacteria group bacterium]|nr:hypothetical protein [Patescibacteria group bacterium]